MAERTRRRFYGTPEKRFWRWTDRDGPTSPLVDERCWLFGQVSVQGYGTFKVAGRTVLAHRFAYELLVGPIPEGLILDHLCRNRQCVNPAHLEPVTSRVNTLRGETIAAAHKAKTGCPAGHAYDRIERQKDGRVGRRCRQCKNANARARYHEQRSQMKESR